VEDNVVNELTGRVDIHIATGNRPTSNRSLFLSVFRFLDKGLHSIIDHCKMGTIATARKS